MSETDIWQSATKFIQIFEEKAIMAAGMCEDVAHAQGDPDLCRTWEQITAAIVELQRRSESGQTAIN